MHSRLNREMIVIAEIWATMPPFDLVHSLNTIYNDSNPATQKAERNSKSFKAANPQTEAFDCVRCK
jgi:hypothetical protein